MRVIPVQIITSKLEELRADRAVFAKHRKLGGDQVIGGIDSQIDILEDLLALTRQSAEDQLTRAEAMWWSGLSSDALDTYPSTGTYSEKRWRRRDLPLRTPYGKGAGPARNADLSARGAEKAVAAVPSHESQPVTLEAAIEAAALEAALAAA